MLRRGQAVALVLSAPLSFFLYASQPEGSLCRMVMFRTILDSEDETRTREKAAAQWETEVRGLRVSGTGISKLLGYPSLPSKP